MAEFLSAAPLSGSWYCSCWLTVTLLWPAGTLEIEQSNR